VLYAARLGFVIAPSARVQFFTPALFLDAPFSKGWLGAVGLNKSENSAKRRNKHTDDPANNKTCQRVKA
jgi:hypothetical protein